MAGRALLPQFCIDNGVEEGPEDVLDAKPGVVYAVLSCKRDWQPVLAMRTGKRWLYNFKCVNCPGKRQWYRGLCQSCWIAGDPPNRACPRCQKRPKSVRRDDHLCGHCIEALAFENKLIERRQQLKQFCLENEVEEAPLSIKDAVPGKIYATLNDKLDHQPCLVTKRLTNGRQWHALAICTVDGCSKRATHSKGTLCVFCYIKQDPKVRACPTCQISLRKESHPSGECNNCVRKASVSSKKEVAQQGLQQFCIDNDAVEPPPNKADAKRWVRYAVSSRLNNWELQVMLYNGRNYTQACVMNGCTKGPASHGPRNKLCIAHGGGVRCAVEGAHMTEEDEKRGCPPLGMWTLSANARINNYPKPELEGTRCCMDCLRHLDPENIAVKVLVQKEHLVVAAVAHELYVRGHGNLVTKLKHDCTVGPSRRRADLALRISGRLLIDIENDEDQHVHRTTSCERRKLAGHMADHGAAAYTDAEGQLWDPPHPSEEDLEALRDTPADTPAMQRLRRDRKAATQRVLRNYARASRGLAEGEVIAPHLHVLRFNCDAFTADDGTNVGALFHKPKTDTKDESKVLKLEPTKAFAPAIKRLVDELLALCALEADDAWFEAQPELAVEYFRYDGCRRDGSDPNGTVAKAHAAQAAADDEAVPLHPLHAKNKATKRKWEGEFEALSDSDSE